MNRSAETAAKIAGDILVARLSSQNQNWNPDAEFLGDCYETIFKAVYKSISEADQNPGVVSLH